MDTTLTKISDEEIEISIAQPPIIIKQKKSDLIAQKVAIEEKLALFDTEEK